MRMKVRSPLVSALALPLLLLVLAAGTARADDVARELEKARLLSAGQDFRNACKAYTKANELAHGKSAPSLIGLSDCYTQIKDYDKAVETARQAVAVAASPDERSQAADALGQALLHQPGEKSWTEAAALFKQEMTSSDGARGAGGLFSALHALHRDAEAAELVRSLRNGSPGKDEVQHVLCGLDRGGYSSKHPESAQEINAHNEFVRKLDPDAPLQVGGDVTRPKVQPQAPPEMTREAKRHLGEPFQVILETIIDPQGRLRSIKVLKGEPWGLTESAENAVRQWTFTPATLDGSPVPVCYVLTVTFQAR